jgi:hypothetical protein
MTESIQPVVTESGTSSDAAPSVNHFSRRDFLKAGAAITLTTLTGLPALAAESWNPGDVAHLLPTANHDRVLLKASFRRSLAQPPRLLIGDKTITGTKSDSMGRFWQFDARGLKADTGYKLQLVDAAGVSLCSPWPLKTFPRPDAAPERLRLLVYTCAGGDSEAKGPGGMEVFRSLAIRHALLERGLAMQPDVVIANGDHVYQDQRTWLESNNPGIRKAANDFYEGIGKFDTAQPVLGTDNERILTKVVDPQIAHLYGTRLRSTPVFFMMDDHDYFENDEAEENFITFPPDSFDLNLARSVQGMYYPEFLPDATRSPVLPSTNNADRAPGTSECFGTLRYGKLLEVLMYDCGRHLSLKDRHAGLVPPEAERWLLDRTRNSEARHLVHMASTPFGWSAGKWREWYPDVVVSDEILASKETTISQRFGGVQGKNLRLGTEKNKYMWQSGWFAQHQRLIRAMTEQQRPAIMMSGDLHATGWDRILKSGDIDLRRNPLNVVLNGTLGTGLAGWPSGPRGLGPAAPAALTLERNAKPMEKNGFTIVDVTPDKIVCQMFAWREPDPLQAIATLQPYDVLEIPRVS